MNPPAAARPSPFFATMSSIILATSLVHTGCSQKSPVAEAEIPDSPPEAIQTILEGLEANQPQVLWTALPPSYQADLQELQTIFCANMDADLYDKTFQILGKVAKVLDKQEEYIFNSPMALNTPLIESNIGNHWDEVVGIMNSVVTSDIATIESLSQIEPTEFLASTGHKFMEDLQDLSQKSQRPGRQTSWEYLNQAIEDAGIRFTSSTNGQGTLQFNRPDGTVEDVELTQVEGRWVPSDLASSWDMVISQAKEGMERLNGPEFQQIKPMVSLVWSTVEHTINQLLRAESQKEFDQVLSGLGSIRDMIGPMGAAFGADTQQE